jgi:hypothetical protein
LSQGAIAALRMRRDNAFTHAFQQTPVGPSLGGNYSLVVIEHEYILRVLSRVPTLEEAARILVDGSTLWRKRK